MAPRFPGRVVVAAQDHSRHQQHTYSEMAESADQISADFKNEFTGLVEAVNRFGVDGVVYHQYCPMEDGAWLSSEEHIMNPYAPETMLRCGSVIDRIES